MIPPTATTVMITSPGVLSVLPLLPLLTGLGLIRAGGLVLVPVGDGDADDE